MRVLVVEDDALLGDAIQAGLYIFGSGCLEIKFRNLKAIF